ncbi:nuclear transport factor 2 family protein [Pedobacter sp. HMWF019]|uniref:nuclear transport factor 2 family protein n=1 Tax=Pedobacter sp. HMWF019 TaxID=2056856 RepID=UPI000D359139|nr:nuclear transport factor 2 family protein [Pedobacter sp. HMWF019]PTS98553.1 nuclear transport factor 2 family protein [Pedobacter sp. HMWF019]
MKNNKAIFKELFQDMFANQVYNESVISHYFTPEYRQEVDGKILIYEQFCKHIMVQKEVVASMTFEFQTLIEERNILFSNHIATIKMKNGENLEIRIIGEFHFINGKINYCNELTHMISGDSSNKDLGSRH